MERKRAGKNVSEYGFETSIVDDQRQARRLIWLLCLPLSYWYVPVGFESGLSLGILGDNVGHESSQSLIETNLKDLVLGNLDLDLALEVTIGQGNHFFGGLVDFLVGSILGDSQFAVESAAFELELALLGLLGLDDVPWKLLEWVGNLGECREFGGVELEGLLSLCLLLGSKRRNRSGEKESRCYYPMHGDVVLFRNINVSGCCWSAK